MARSTSSVPFEAARDVPGLIVKFGDCPLHHGGVGAIRAWVASAFPRTRSRLSSWPPHAGMTANAYVGDNPELADLAARFMRFVCGTEFASPRLTKHLKAMHAGGAPRREKGG